MRCPTQNVKKRRQEKERTMSRMKLWLAVALALAVVAPVAADDGEEKKIRKIQVQKLVQCADGEDCDEQVSRMVFVGDDGDVRVLHDGDHEWIHERIFDGNVEILKADGPRLHLRLGGGAFLGVQLSDLTPELRTHFGVPEDAGVMVGKLVDGSPAFRAGLEVGDIVTAVDGEPVASSSALARAIRDHEDGDTVLLEVWRDGRMQKISATLEEQERRVEMSRAMSAASDGQAEARVIEVKVDCEDGEDCTVDVENANSFEFAASACGDSGECEVNVDCTDGDCACTVNGETADCSVLGF